jgi:PAS domain S-box-containing protein
MDRFVEQGCNLEPQMISWKQLKPIKLGVEIMNDTILEGLSFSNFIRNGPIIMFIYNRHFQYVWTNTAFQEYTGYSNEDALQMKFWEVIHPDHQGLVRTNALARQRGEKVPNSYELKILTKNGEEKWVDVFLFEEWMGDQPYVMLGAYGITERIHAQTQLQKAYDHLDQLVQERTKELTISNQALMLKEKLLMDIISNMSDGVIIISCQGEIEFINQTLKIMLGRTSVDIREQLSYEKLVADNKNLEKMLTKKQAFRDEEIVLTIEGREMQFLATGTPIEDPDGTTHKGILMLKPLAEVHRLVNRYSISPARFCFDDILTRSEIMRDTIELAKAASQNKSTILIQGESGTGKEMFAQSIHNQSRYADGPFIAVNCGAIPRELVGSELFGYVEGAFTGARKGGSPGKFELAQGGTLFLDEIGDMPLEQQAALLRVLQEKQVCRLEAFISPGDVLNDPAWPKDISADNPVTLTVQRSSGEIVTINTRVGEPVLTALEKAGLAVPNACRTGECSLCRVKMTAGKVFQPNSALVRQSDRLLGYIHSCRAYPLSDLTLVIQ